MEYRFVSVPAYAAGEDLVRAWDRLSDRVADARPESRPSWVGAADRLRPEGRTHVHAAFVDRELVAVFPLSTTETTVRGVPCRVAEGPHLDAVRASGPLVREDHRTPALLRAWARAVDAITAVDLIRLSSLPPSGAMAAMSSQAGLPCALEAGRSVRLVDARAPDRLQRLSSRQFRNLDRLRRRAAAEHGTLRLSTFERPERIERGLDLFVTLEASGWKGEWNTLSALAYSRPERLFHTTVMRELAAHSCARVDVLHAGPHPVSAQLAVRGGKTWHVTRMGYDEAYRAIGPGGLLFRAFLERVAADPDIDAVDLGSAPPWSDRWHLDEIERVDLQIFRPTRRGRLLQAASRGDAPAPGGGPVRDGSLLAS